MVSVQISYFYQIRYFKPYMIPLSTAVWDPKWYHNNQSQSHTFLDKNGVINGLRIHPLMPGKECDGLCTGRENCPTGKPDECEFLKVYSRQLHAIDFEEFMNKLEDSRKKLTELLRADRDLLFVLIVHENCNNPCSEREALKEWFSYNKFPIHELCYPINKYY